MAGAVLSVLPGPTTVYETAGWVHVGGSALHLVQTTTDTAVYDGDGAYVLIEPGDGSARATASWSSGGRAAATCSMHRDPQRLVEECRFTVNDTTFTALDTLDLNSGGVWHRTYGDGRQTTIAVPANGAVIPLAFPIGR